MTRFVSFWFLVACLCALPGKLAAHTQSYGYLDVTTSATAITGTLQLAARDLNRLTPLDTDLDGSITWGEIRKNEPQVAALALSTITITRNSQPCLPQAQEVMLDQHLGETYVVMPFKASCTGEEVTVTYNTLFAIDALHRGMIKVNSGGVPQQTVASPDARSFTFQDQAQSTASQMASFLNHGVSHLLSGYDHLLFLITLLLATAVNNCRESLRKGLTDAAKVVTAFTLAHSLTLGLAATGIINLPVTLTEAAIAVTITLAAANNLWPVIRNRIWALALGFGLIHGLGFANVLTDLGLERSGLVTSLFAFNLGVELGQLLVVGLALPLLMIAARRVALVSGFTAANALIALIGCAWFSDRIFETSLMPF